VIVSDDPSAQDIAALDDRIDRFNVDRSGIDDARFLSILLRTDAGALYAGLHGHSWGGYCEIKSLWVAEEWRGRGIGSALIEAAEAEAIGRGCDRIILSTHSFQAPDFYARHGFRIVAEIADCPRGFSHLLLIKTIGR
jgi:ribosomal protein S18 acetylase RimI-like enzyme